VRKPALQQTIATTATVAVTVAAAAAVAATVATEAKVKTEAEEGRATMVEEEEMKEVAEVTSGAATKVRVKVAGMKVAVEATEEEETKARMTAHLMNLLAQELQRKPKQQKQKLATTMITMATRRAT
jgi:FlaG/FlaF family flagellin (archaellin)